VEIKDDAALNTALKVAGLRQQDLKKEALKDAVHSSYDLQSYTAVINSLVALAQENRAAFVAAVIEQAGSPTTSDKPAAAEEKKPAEEPKKAEEKPAEEDKKADDKKGKGKKDKKGDAAEAPKAEEEKKVEAPAAAATESKPAAEEKKADEEQAAKYTVKSFKAALASVKLNDQLKALQAPSGE
jgi:hypothetical protein